MTFSSLRLLLVSIALPVAVATAACAAPEIPTGPSVGSSKKPPAKKDKPGTGGTSNNNKPTTPAEPGSNPPPAAPQDQAPTLTAVTPAAIAIGSAPNGADLTLTGTRFAEGAKVDVAGTKIPATFESPTSLKVKIPSDRLNAAGTLRLTVEVKPGVPSNALTLTVANPTNVTITDLAPKNAILGSTQPVTIAVTGSGFVQTSVVRFNGAQLQTTFNSASSLNASIPASALIDAGKFSVTVATGADVISLPATFEVQNPSPSTNGITPSSVAAGSSATVVTISGSGFSKGAEVLAGTTPLATTFLSATSLRATVPSNLITQAGTSVRLVVQTGSPGGGTSEAQTLTVTAQASGTTGGATTNNNPANCAYLCADYNYSPGQCFQGYYCIESGTYAGCLGTAQCEDTTTAGGGAGAGGAGAGAGSSCEYDCATYNYAPGECYQDYYCSVATGCLTPAICE